MTLGRALGSQAPTWGVPGTPRAAASVRSTDGETQTGTSLARRQEHPVRHRTIGHEVHPRLAPPHLQPRMDKKALSERDICTKYITPALASGRLGRDAPGARERHLTKGRVIVRGKLVARGKREARRLPALPPTPTSRSPSIEAKDNNHSVGAGMQQALAYAEHARRAVRVLLERRRVPVPRPHRHRAPVERESRARRVPVARGAVAALPRLEGARRPTPRRSSPQDYYADGGGKEPRYYQRQRHQPRRSRPSPRARSASCS